MQHAESVLQSPVYCGRRSSLIWINLMYGFYQAPENLWLPLRVCVNIDEIQAGGCGDGRQSSRLKAL